MQRVEQAPREPVRIELSGGAAMELDECSRRYQRTKQVYTGLTWRLARDPGIGEPIQWHDDEFVDGAEIRIAKTERSSHVPRVTVVYRFNPGLVSIIAIRVEPAGYNPVM